MMRLNAKAPGPAFYPHRSLTIQAIDRTAARIRKLTEQYDHQPENSAARSLTLDDLRDEEGIRYQLEAALNGRGYRKYPRPEEGKRGRPKADV